MGNSLSYLLKLTREIFGLNPLIVLFLIGEKHSLKIIENSENS
jgi:hypothetical protein